MPNIILFWLSKRSMLESIVCQADASFYSLLVVHFRPFEEGISSKRESEREKEDAGDASILATLCFKAKPSTLVTDCCAHTIRDSFKSHGQE